MRSDFNFGANRTRSHPERTPQAHQKWKDPAKLAVGFATAFLDFARNDGGYYAQASSAGGSVARVSGG